MPATRRSAGTAAARRSRRRPKASIETGSMSMRDTDAPVKVEIIVARIRSDPAYAAQFAAALPSLRVDIEAIVTAIAAFERTLERGDERVVEVGGLLEDDAGLVAGAPLHRRLVGAARLEDEQVEPVRQRRERGQPQPRAGRRQVVDDAVLGDVLEDRLAPEELGVARLRAPVRQFHGSSPTPRTASIVGKRFKL